MKPTSANGVEGVLLYSFDGNYSFRVYHNDHTFTDYQLRHSDISITIVDEDAYFYKHADGTYSLDHSPNTLGIS